MRIRLPLVLALGLVAAPALAADFSSPILGPDGKTPIPSCDAKGSDGKITAECAKPVTLGELSENVLLMSFPDERDLSGDEKAKRGQLALEIMSNPKLVPSSEQITTLKKLIGKAYGPLIVLRAWNLLDPSTQKAAAEPAAK